MTDNKDWKQVDWPELNAWNKAQDRKPTPATLETLVLQNDMLYGKMDRMHNTICELEKRVSELTEILKLKVT